MDVCEKIYGRRGVTLYVGIYLYRRGKK